MNLSKCYLRVNESSATNESYEVLIISETEWILFLSYVSEVVFIVLVNAFTLATFATNHQLRKRSTYLIINLTVADLLFGTTEGLLSILEPAILERYLPRSTEEWFSWQKLMLLTLYFLFPVASLVYILLISLERLHATIYPFKHCLIGGKVYFRIIAFSWLVALVLAFVFAFLLLRVSFVFPYVYASFAFITLLILAVSYVRIILNVKKYPHSAQNFGSLLSEERKLSLTLFIMTLTSFLTILPAVIWDAIIADHLWQDEVSLTAIAYRVSYTFDALYLFNPILNPLIYAIRMQQFRRAAKKLICKKKSGSIGIESVESLAM